MAAFRSFGHVLRTVVLAVPLYAVVLLLGAVSLVWNVVAMLLYPVLPPGAGRWLGRQAISRACARFSANAFSHNTAFPAFRHIIT